MPRGAPSSARPTGHCPIDQPRVRDQRGPARGHERIGTHAVALIPRFATLASPSRLDSIEDRLASRAAKRAKMEDAEEAATEDA